jgi:hypothetical protein
MMKRLVLVRMILYTWGDRLNAKFRRASSLLLMVEIHSVNSLYGSSVIYSCCCWLLPLASICMVAAPIINVEGCCP